MGPKHKHGKHYVGAPPTVRKAIEKLETIQNVKRIIVGYNSNNHVSKPYEGFVRVQRVDNLNGAINLVCYSGARLYELTIVSHSKESADQIINDIKTLHPPNQKIHSR